MPELDTRVIQVSNISPVTAKDQMKTLFNYIGKIDEIRLYPESEAIEVATRVCYIKFRDYEDAGVALHLTNTVFIDRALIVVPVLDGKIPDEQTALGLNSMKGDSQNYPALPASTEFSKVEEIRRTIYVTNVDAAVLPEALMSYFTQAGEVKYVRMAGNEGGVTRSCFIEFTDQISVVKALGLSGQVLGNYEIRVSPSNNAIVKTVLPGVTATSREIEEAMRKVNEAQSLISAAVDPDRAYRSRSRRSRSKRSRSKSRRRSHHRSYSRRSRSRKSRSHHRSASKRSPSHKSLKKKQRSHSRSRDKKKRSRSRGKKDKKEVDSSKKKERSEGSKKEVRKRSKSHDRSTKKSKRESSRVGREKDKKSTHSAHHSSSHRHSSKDRSARKKSRDRREKSKERSKKSDKSKKESKVEKDYDTEEKEETEAIASDVEEQQQPSDDDSYHQENSANEEENDEMSEQEGGEDPPEED